AASSNGVKIDSTGPTTGTVRDGASDDLAFQISTSSLNANWSGFSDGAGIGIASYQWAIGTTSGGTNVLNWTSSGISGTSASKTGLPLSSGSTYYISVRGIDVLGNTGSSASSNGVTVDTSGPAPGTVNDGPGADINYQASISTISANWSGFTDVSGIASYQWA